MFAARNCVNIDRHYEKKCLAVNYDSRIRDNFALCMSSLNESNQAKLINLDVPTEHFLTYFYWVGRAVVGQWPECWM